MFQRILLFIISFTLLHRSMFMLKETKEKNRVCDPILYILSRQDPTFVIHE